MMNRKEFLRFMRILTTTNADDPDMHDANDYALKLLKRLDAAIVRAEAAENELHNARTMAIKYGDRAEAAGKRVAELEAQLAETWRPVTDDDPSENVLVELLVTGYRNADGCWVYPDGTTPIRAWRFATPSNSTG